MTAPPTPATAALTRRATPSRTRSVLAWRAARGKVHDGGESPVEPSPAGPGAGHHVRPLPDPPPPGRRQGVARVRRPLAGARAAGPQGPQGGRPAELERNGA